MTVLKNVFRIFYPKLCANCENLLTENEKTVCTFCRHDIPLFYDTNYSENKITKIFYGRVLLEKATTLLSYRKEGITKKLIHALKYKGNEEIGIFLGNWFGEILKENNQFDDIDYIIPVALHPKKRKQRGYNQVSKFGKIMGSHLKKPFLEHILLRTTISKTQTFKARFERFNTIDSPFHLKNTSFLKNKHILLIDDVITTGATIEACAKELQKIENVKISILSMAYTE